MTLWPWGRRYRREREQRVADAERRLVQAEELVSRAKDVSESLRGHMRRNDFGAMIDDEVFRGLRR